MVDKKAEHKAGQVIEIDAEKLAALKDYVTEKIENKMVSDSDKK